MANGVLKVGAATLNQLPMDWQGNRERILQAVRMARKEGVQLLCLPELCVSGHGCEDAFHGASLAQYAWESLLQIVPHTRDMAVALGLPVIYRGSLYDCAALLVDGGLAGLNAKRVLAGAGVYYEPRWFQPWQAGRQEGFRHEGKDIPFGDVIYNVEGLRIGFEICEEAWAGGPGQAPETAEWLDVWLNPSASHFAFAKHATLRRIVQEASRRLRAVYVYSNLLGNESGRLIFDGALFIASHGDILTQQKKRFGFREVSLCVATVDLNQTRLEQRRINYPVIAQMRQGSAFAWVKAPFLQQNQASMPLLPPDHLSTSNPNPLGKPSLAMMPTPPLNASSDLSKEEEFLGAEALGLWDYLRKSHSAGFLVSLSGGVDSACVLVLCGAALRFALAELGWGTVCAKLPGWLHLGQSSGDFETDLATLNKRLLLSVYQGGQNSSQTTRLAAKALANSLNAKHLEVDIQPLVDAYEELAAKALNRTLSWEHDDLARQNIQARVRSPGIWLLANVEGRLLLSTSNRSEAGVGYATMDGDTSGGLAPIAGANKSFLRQWLNWIETQTTRGMGPLPALAQINKQAPTAELRPQGDIQQDEKDLMPYPVLDAIEQAAIRDRLSPIQVWQRLLHQPLAGYTFTAQTAAAQVTRFFQLWGRSQWKRERLAPSFHLDDENLDPKTWCRFPILQAGYAAELAELQKALDQLGM